MLKSIWRYSHLMLAVSSFLILSLLSITGVFLAADPIIEQQKGFRFTRKSEVALGEMIPMLKEKHPSISSISVNDYGMILMQHTDDQDETAIVYIDPETGAILGNEASQTPLMEWMTNLHRSIFLKETGRAIVGITSALLILITISGILLLIQRQRGIKRFFAPAGDKGSAQYYHVVWGRVSLLLILFIAITGGYLSYERFFPDTNVAILEVATDQMAEEPLIALPSFSAWENLTLEDVKKIQFPFSEFPEDYYELHLKDRNIAVNQFTGDVIATAHISAQKQWQAWALDWHTGRNSILWTVILGIGSGYIMFFIISGFIITFKRLRKTSHNKYKPSEATHIILVGSENGSTKRYASSIFRQLIQQGHKAYISTLNEWTPYDAATDLIILTATYGDGEAPHSAQNALELIQKISQVNTLRYSIVGFGSRQYPDFCQYAYDLSAAIQQQVWSQELLPVYTVDDKSPSDFALWLQAYNTARETALNVDPAFTRMPKRKMIDFKVKAISTLDENETFTLKLSYQQKGIISGDLLSIFPTNDYRERLYSIGIVDQQIQLCIKQQYGLGTTFLSQLQVGDRFKGSIIKNVHFHLPKEKNVIMICNGTGIAPFLGMIAASQSQSIQLYCGFRTAGAFDTYKAFLEERKAKQQLNAYHVALSRAETKTYVSDLLVRDANEIAQALKNGDVIMICGSINMMRDVVKTIEQITISHQIDWVACKENGQLLTDCY